VIGKSGREPLKSPDVVSGGELIERIEEDYKRLVRCGLGKGILKRLHKGVVIAREVRFIFLISAGQLLTETRKQRAPIR
jgi:hypothetical protein